MTQSSFLMPILKVNILIVGLFVFGIYLVFQKKKYIGAKAKKFSKEAQKKIDMTVRIFFVLALIVLFGFLVSLIKDDLWVTRQENLSESIPSKTGMVSARHTFLGGLWFISQGFVFEDDKSTDYRAYLISTPMFEGHTYKVYYLPNSKAVLRVSRVNEDY